jgi:hypothetical protein
MMVVVFSPGRMETLPPLGSDCLNASLDGAAEVKRGEET